MVLPKKKPRDEAGLTDRRCSGIQIVTAGRSSSVGTFTRMCVWYVWCCLLTVLISELLHEINECLDALLRTRSEERRVGKECRARWSADDQMKQNQPHKHGDEGRARDEPRAGCGRTSDNRTQHGTAE